MLLGGDFSGALMPPIGNQILVTVVEGTDGSYAEARFKIVHNGNGSQTASTAFCCTCRPATRNTLYLVFVVGKGIALTLFDVRRMMPKAISAAATDHRF